ncbi:MAG: hypothetical protein HDR89_06975 [Bacteroides sp.]|nr:hypothetical protein [Bacteroides sp.]
MKHLAKIFVLILIATLSACTNTTSQIAEKAQKSLPYGVPGIGQLSKAYAEESNLILTTDASDRHLNYDIILQNIEASKKSLGQQVNATLYALGIMEDVYNSRSNVIFRFEWNDGRKVDVEITHNEIFHE